MPAARPAGPGVVLRVGWTGYQLPEAICDEAAVAVGPVVLLAGGELGRHRRPTATVLRLDPVTGRTSAAGHLAGPVTGAAAALLGGVPVVYGGRSRPGLALAQVPAARSPERAGRAAAPFTARARAAAAAAIAARLADSPGRLPSARYGLAAVTLGARTYLVGGQDAARILPAVLSTGDGRHFSVAARLPVPVSEAGVVAAGGALWVFGGMTPRGPTDVIQRVDPRTGQARVAGRLPRPLAAASAFRIGGRIFLAGGLTSATAGTRRAPAAGRTTATGAVLGYDPASGATSDAGTLPMPLAHAAVAVVRGTAYLIGGTDGRAAVPAVVAVRMAGTTAARPAGTAGGAAGPPAPRAVTPGPLAPAASAAPWLAPARGRGHLAPGSDPSALPADVLIADHLNNRLIIVDPRGRIRWVFPRKGDLAAGQRFRVPDDAFFSPDGRYIIATQEDDQVISVIDVAAHRIVYQYGRPGTPGSGPNRVDNPDDAMLLPGGDILVADIKNCRILLIRPPAHRPRRIIGRTSSACWHDPPRRFGSPNGAFPMSDGHVLVTEINGDWASEVTLRGRVLWSAHPPGVAYPSDTNEVYPGRFITADYSDPGQVVEFSQRGRLLWRFGGLNRPSLAVPMPNGDILVNDDFNDRVIVIDPATGAIVWQYGHTGVPGRAPGYLNDPDGLDLVPPDSLLIRNAPALGGP